MKVKILTNDFNISFTVEAKESHKAYYLFNNPEKRGTFTNGVAILGKDIKSIVPDFNTTMDWNPSYKMSDDDWNEIRKKGLDKKAQFILEKAAIVAKMAEENPALLQMALSKAIVLLPENKNQNAISDSIERIADKFKKNDP